MILTLGTARVYLHFHLAQARDTFCPLKRPTSEPFQLSPESFVGVQVIHIGLKKVSLDTFINLIYFNSDTSVPSWYQMRTNRPVPFRWSLCHADRGVCVLL